MSDDGLDGRASCRYLQQSGETYRAKGDFDRAIADYNEAVRLDHNWRRASVGAGVPDLLAGAACRPSREQT
jgi:tetratricopeptide (TPR) repeat protein